VHSIYKIPKLPKWGVAVALKLLSVERWFDLPEISVHAAASIVSRHIPAARALAEQIGVPAEVTRLLPAFFTGRFFDQSVPTTTLYGVLEMEMIKPQAALAYHNWSPAVWDQLAETKGYFRAIYSVFNLMRSCTTEAVEQLRSDLGGLFANAEMLPFAVTAFLKQVVTRT
jgi:hypothetical protein